MRAIIILLSVSMVYYISQAHASALILLGCVLWLQCCSTQYQIPGAGVVRAASREGSAASIWDAASPMSLRSPLETLYVAMESGRVTKCVTAAVFRLALLSYALPTTDRQYL